MILELSNKIKVLEGTEHEIQHIVSKYTFDNPDYLIAVKHQRSTWNLERSMALYEFAEEGKHVYLPIGCLKYLTAKFNPQLCDHRIEQAVQCNFTLDLLPYQERVITQCSQHTEGLVVAPSRSDKFVCAIALAARLQQRTLILVNRKNLIQPWREQIELCTREQVSLLGRDKTDNAKNLFTVAMLQTLDQNNVEDLNYGLVLVDECHNLPAQQAYQVLSRINAKYKFGFSATEQRKDARGFMVHAAVGDVIAKVEVSSLDKNSLPVRVKVIKRPFVGSVYDLHDFFAALSHDNERNQFIVQCASKLSLTSPTLIVCHQTAHCETLVRIAKEQNIDIVLLQGRAQQQMSEALHVPIVVGTYASLAGITDWPPLGALILATPVSANADRLESPKATRLLQAIDRCQRPYPNRKGTLVVDIVDEHLFGFSMYAKRKRVYKQQGFELRHY